MALIQAEIWDGFCPEGSRGFNPFDTLTLAQGNPGVSTHKRQDNCQALRWANGFVPEGQHDRSQARSAWNHEENSSVPARRLRHSNHRIGAHTYTNHTVPYGTALLGGAFPGTSCQATIASSLRDKSHSPIEAPHNYLCLT